MDSIKFKNPIKATIKRADGTIEVLPDIFNGVTDEGFNYLLGVGFRNQAVETNWYTGLIVAEPPGIPTLADADTLASKAWTEDTNYSEVTRPEWVATVITDKQVGNTVTVDFTFNATTTIRGIFIASNNTKGGTTGKLWSTALFGADQTYNNTDVLSLTYNITAS